MGGIEVNASSTVCRKCGTAYSRLKGYFPVSYAQLYKGTTYLPYCRECVDSMYNMYLTECQDPKAAVRQMCRKLDLYWNETCFAAVERQNATRTMMTNYISKVNGVKYAGKSYDDTLKEEGVLWLFPNSYTAQVQDDVPVDPEPMEDVEVPEDVRAFWGPGHTADAYLELEERKNYWLTQLPEDSSKDPGVQALLRQIVGLEIEINRDRASGKSTEKQAKVLSDLLGSAMLKPSQKKDGSEGIDEKTPFGVWIKRWEDERPVPEPDPELKDVDGIVKYILTWVYGHLARMLNIKNAYSRLYEEEIAKYRVEHPEFDDEDDESMLYDIFSDDPSVGQFGGEHEQTNED